jgi:hypothetical protein
MTEQDDCTTVVEDEACLRAREPNVQREQHGAGEQHAEVRLEQLVGVPAQPGDTVARLYADVTRQRGGQPVAARRELRVRQPELAVDDTDAIREKSPGSLEEVERCEGDVQDVH